MTRRYVILLSISSVAVLALLACYVLRSSIIKNAGIVLNTVRSANNPPGTAVVEVSEATVSTATLDEESPADAGSWPSYNRTLTSQRYSPLSQINEQTAHDLKVLCTYDTHLREGFEPGPIVVDGALVFTTTFDMVSIDPSNCGENWRTHEDYKVLTYLRVNRGAAYAKGRLFRGTLDGRVLAYDFRTGKRLWATAIADPRTGEVVDAAPIAWNGLIFIGVGLGDVKGVKGRMYALSADSGRIVWETYLVPEVPGDPVRGPRGVTPASAVHTWKNAADVPISGGGTWTSATLDASTGQLYVPVGNPAPDFIYGVREGTNLYTSSVVALDARNGAYINYFPMARSEWHDWDVASAPALFTTRAGKHLLSFSPKNGYLYSFDLATNQLLYRSPVTRIENADVPLSADKPVHFCPGVGGGSEWNGAAYHPQTNLILTGETEWCTTVTTQTNEQVKAIRNGEIWVGHVADNRLDALGLQDSHSNWAGWLYATDADSGQWKWRLKTNYPILSGVTPTAGGIVFFGDMGGNVYAVSAKNGRTLWRQKLQGAIAGGVISYTAAGAQRIAVAAGLTSILWPTEQATAKIVIIGLARNGKSGADVESPPTPRIAQQPGTVAALCLEHSSVTDAKRAYDQPHRSDAQCYGYDVELHEIVSDE